MFPFLLAHSSADGHSVVMSSTVVNIRAYALSLGVVNPGVDLLIARLCLIYWGAAKLFAIAATLCVPTSAVWGSDLSACGPSLGIFWVFFPSWPSWWVWSDYQCGGSGWREGKAGNGQRETLVDCPVERGAWGRAPSYDPEIMTWAKAEG